MGCSPWGCKESDTTEQLHFHFSLSCTAEGDGSPLQCSCLGNPREGGDWWAAVYGVAQSWTRLKQLSSSSSQAEEREEYSSHSWDVQGVLAVVEACPMLLQSEVGHALSQRRWPQVVGPQEEPSCTGSQEGVGSNLCLFTTWWLLWAIKAQRWAKPSAQTPEVADHNQLDPPMAFTKTGSCSVGALVLS